MIDVIPITPPRRKAEPTDRGLGIALCFICHLPCADHQIGPCPELTDPSMRHSAEDRWTDRNYYRHGVKPPVRQPKMRQVKPPPGFAPTKELEL